MQSIDFFGALRARVYDDAIRRFLENTGFEQMGKRMVNSREAIAFDKPSMDLVRQGGCGECVACAGQLLALVRPVRPLLTPSLLRQDSLLAYGQMVVMEQENVRRVQLANEYLNSAALAGADGSSMPEVFST